MGLNQQQIVDELKQWMETFVEVPNPALGNWAPCPYARQARINNQISFKFCLPDEFTDVIRESLSTLENKDVVVVCFDHRLIDPESLRQWVINTNRVLMPADYVILEDHPDAKEFVSGVNMNFGKCGLLVMQKLSNLNTAADQLRAKGYYEHWDSASLDEVVNWRYE